MSCSKMQFQTSTFRMHSPTLPPAAMFKYMKTQYGYKYDVEELYFSIKTLDNDLEYYIMLVFRTNDKDNEKRVAAISLWKIVDEHTPTDPRAFDEIHVLDNKTEVRDIKCKATQAHMFELERDNTGVGFTTNDPFAMDSFTRLQYKPRCTEYSVMCIAKTLHNMAFTAALSSADLLHIALTSPHISADTLWDIIEDLPNEKRFKERAPKGLSGEELKSFKVDSLFKAREAAKQMGAEEFKARYQRLEERNLHVDPTSKPSIFKDKIGRGLLMCQPAARSWDKKVGLKFFLATSKNFCESPVNLALALTAHNAFIVEVTPKDARYGVKPPTLEGKTEGERLDWCAETPAGKAWFVALTKTHGAKQEEFIGRFKGLMDKANATKRKDFDERQTYFDEALHMMTDEIDKYEYGILGLTKALVLRVFTGQIKLHAGFEYHVMQYLHGFGIDWGFQYFHKVHVTLHTDGSDQDPFMLLQSVSSGLEM
jgi:hypothetical protein